MDKLDELQNELREIEGKLQWLLERGSNDEQLIYRKRELDKKIQDLQLKIKN